MAKSAETKTNVMRILDQKKIPYTPHSYEHDEGMAVDGISVAERLGENPEQVFKTLVTKGASGAYYVFDIPVAETLHLKNAAKSVREKSVELVPVSEIQALTGYIRGGCSPIGMKKQFRTVIDESAMDYETIIVSGGKIGTQVELSPQELVRLLRAETAALTV